MQTVMKKILTISIAAYNVGAYIRKALESLDIPKVIDKLEIFVVDDGGQDDTLSIAEEFAQKYPESVFPIHKENGGYGSVQNWSIEHATGKYIKLLDGDDWFDKEGLKNLVDALNSSSADIVATNSYRYIGDENGARSELRINMKDGLYASAKCVKEPLPIWSLCFRTEMIQQSGVQLPHNSLYTDAYLTTMPFYYSKSIQILNRFVYCYRLGRDGQSVSRESRIKHFSSMVKIVSELAAWVHDKKKCTNYCYILVRLCRTYQWSIVSILLDKPSRENLQYIKAYELSIREICLDLYKQAGKQGKLGLMLSIFRKLDYLPYWLIALLPNGFPNKG